MLAPLQDRVVLILAPAYLRLNRDQVEDRVAAVEDLRVPEATDPAVAVRERMHGFDVVVGDGRGDGSRIV